MSQELEQDISVASRRSPVALLSSVKRELRKRYGDRIFAISYGEKKADVNTVGLLGEAALIESVQRAIMKADGFGILPAYRDISK